MDHIREMIAAGRTALGIELGSTRIKAVLIGEDSTPIAAGSHEWENRLENGVWTYTLDDVWTGLRHSYAEMAADVERQYGVKVERIGSMGFSAMMHGYMAFDEGGKLLVPFRTWRNTMTEAAAQELTELFHFNIPQRWSIAHLYQAILNGEEHVPAIRFLTTLAGYVHWQLSGEKVLGVGEASGMFPIDSTVNDYDPEMMAAFDAHIAGRGFPWKLRDILPRVLVAGEVAGSLTEEGARLLDPTGTLQSGALLCPPEGDAGTGMVATNSVRVRTGNVSAGTSVFAMMVLEKALANVHTEIDMVTTPTGKPVAMVHCNNCTSDLNAWVNLFHEFAGLMGLDVSMGDLFGKLYNRALEGDADCGGLLACNYFSGEPITGFEEGRPLFVRTPDAKFTLANFMRAHLYSALATLKIGLDILIQEEHVQLDRLLGHGGLFKTPLVGQRIMAAAAGVPVSVMETAGEGGAWGIALLAAFTANREEGESLEDYLDQKVFAGKLGETVAPVAEDQAGFAAFLKRYTQGLAAERAAVEHI
ncbi:MAG TPA: FGGY-family carbohydrate kinase [Candidatus Flavonifractor merdigallinarum]|uniref:FGGY-family carbohydrate kinase n=1 Tax=Candidatus Flavonifractor merdigallinarum TaxID=2838589 RepID=A0A9D2BYJ2_9FIRM|nr:FGGY-family carbohydrate kinase [Candidatus Flavonifractor merdigallinarum]